VTIADELLNRRFPPLASANTGDVIRVDRVSPRYGVGVSCGIGYLLRLLFAKFCCVMQFSRLEKIASVAVNHVRCVFLRSSCIQMTWIYTIANVALVVYLHSIWNLSVSYLVGKTMRAHRFPGAPNFPIPLVFCTLPNPAVIWSGKHNLLPKSNLNRSAISTAFLIASSGAEQHWSLLGIALWHKKFIATVEASPGYALFPRFCVAILAAIFAVVAIALERQSALSANVVNHLILIEKVRV
jgi:hypothetical protein